MINNLCIIHNYIDLKIIIFNKDAATYVRGLCDVEKEIFLDSYVKSGNGSYRFKTKEYHKLIRKIWRNSSLSMYDIERIIEEGKPYA